MKEVSSSQLTNEAVLAGYEFDVEGFLNATQKLHKSHVLDEEMLEIQDKIVELYDQREYVLRNLAKMGNGAEKAKVEMLNNRIEELNQKRELVQRYIDFSQAAYAVVSELSEKLENGKHQTVQNVAQTNTKVAGLEL
ncbi:MAG: hypothetical protein PHH71_02465 [Clostridia bacterium]|jgi:hypothetical protein|nr:hypothetical protein [Clostridia bacterium]MDD3862948.1 hypothetical protein [Clostridia bacterium]MDD4408656.1 hypothetical protein [Clostridia bacterium]